MIDRDRKVGGVCKCVLVFVGEARGGIDLFKKININGFGIF